MGRDDQRATTGRLIVGSSLKRAMVSSDMYLDRCTAEGDTDTEMLAKISRHEATLANMVTKTLSLLHAIQMSRTSSEESRRIIDAAPSKNLRISGNWPDFGILWIRRAYCPSTASLKLSE